MTGLLLIDERRPLAPMDRAAQMGLLARAAGETRIMGDEEARLAHRQFGGANMARHSFRVPAEVIREEQPDVLS